MDHAEPIRRDSAASRKVMIALAVSIALILGAAGLALAAIDDPAAVVLDPSARPVQSEPDPSATPLAATSASPTATPTASDADLPVPTADPGEIDPTAPAVPAPDGQPGATASPAPDLSVPEPPAPTVPAPEPPGVTAEEQPAPPAPEPAPAAPSPLPGDAADDTPQPGGQSSLAIGTCLTGTTGVVPPTTVDSVASAPCTGSHSGEVYASELLPLGDGAAYPGGQALGDQTRLLCVGPAYGQYVGREFDDDSRFLVNPLFPTEESWAAGDRGIACYLYDLNGPRTETARGSGL